VAHKNIKLGISYALMNVLCGALYIVWGEPLLQVFSPMTFAFLENFIAFLFLLWAYGLYPEWKKFKQLSWRKISAILALAVCSSVIAPYLFYWGWSLSSATNTFLLSRFEMLFTILFALIFLHERLTLQKIWGILSMFLGVIVLATHGFQYILEMQPGDILLILAGIFWAFGSIVFKKYAQEVSTELILFSRFLIGSIVFGVLMSLAQESQILLKQVSLLDLQHLALYVIFAVIYAKYFYLKAVKVAPLYIFSTVTLAAPGLGLFLNYIFLGEIPQTFHYIGALFLMLGFMILQTHLEKLQHRHHLHHLHPQPQSVRA